MTSTAERWNVLEELDDWLRLPMALLGLAWLLIVVAELLWGENRLLSLASTVVWVIFIAEFALRLALAPHRSSFLKRNWLTVIALIVVGVGMVLASGCGSKTLIRIGGGNLKSVVVFLVLGIVAYMTMRGVLAVLCLTAATVSVFMNNIGALALVFPVAL